MSAILKQKLIDIANGFTKYGLWKGGGSSKLSEMTDVTLKNLKSNDVLTYNGSVWVNDDNLQKQIDTLNSNFYYRTAKLVVTSYSLSFDKDNVGLIIYRVSNSIHAVLAVTYFGTIGITVEELFCSQYVSYTTNGNTISFTAEGSIVFIGTD